MGSHAQCSIHVRLQIESMSKGRAVNRVHTLHGLACLLHVSSDIANNLDILDSKVCCMDTVFLPTVICGPHLANDCRHARNSAIANL